MLPASRISAPVGMVDGAPGAPAATGARRRRQRRRAGLLRLSPRAMENAGDVLLGLSLVGSVLAIGAVHVPVLLVVAPFALLSGILALLSGAVPGGKVMGVAAVVAGLATVCLLQTVPIPMRILSHLAPANADVWARALLPFGGEAPRLATLSLDPGATRVEALKWWSYAAVFVAAASFGARRGASRGALLILGSAAILAVASIGHGLFNSTRVFGLYTPRFGGTGWAVSPLVNHNNRAGYLNLGALCGLGLLTVRRPMVPRWVVALAVATAIGVSVNAGSRGGVVALLGGLVLTWALVRTTRDEPASPGGDSFSPRAAILLTLAGGAAFAFAAATRYTGQLLTSRNLEKLELSRWVLPMLRDFPVFGVGRGAFESAFPVYRTGPDNLVYVSPENFVLQWATEWGLPVTALALSALVWAMRPREWGAAASGSSAGLFAGFAALLAQNLVDLSLEIPGVAMAGVATMGIAWGHVAEKKGGPAADRAPTRAAFVLALSSALTMALVATTSLHTLSGDRDEVHDAFPADARDPAAKEALRRLLHDAMERHPAEPYFPRMGALMAVRSHAENPVPWLQRALERAPTSGRSNYLLATFLASRGYVAQALMQVKLAVAQDPNLTRPATALVIHLSRGEADLWQAAPEGAAGTAMLKSLSGAVRKGNEELSIRLLEEAVRRDPADAPARVALAQYFLSGLEQGDASAGCAGAQRDSCRKRAAQHIAALDALPGRQEESLVLRARFLRVDGRGAEALSLFAARCPSLQRRMKCLAAWLSTSLFVRDREQASHVATLMERDGCSDRSSCAATLSEIGDAFAPRDPLSSLDYYVRAAREDGTRARWIRVAQVARLADRHGEAIQALEAAAAMGTPDPELQRVLDQERLEVLGATRGKR